MVEGKDDAEVTYVNSKTGFGGLRIVQVVDGLIYISETHMEEGHRYPTSEHTINIWIYLWIPIDHFNVGG
jgi:hypothetical protein